VDDEQARGLSEALEAIGLSVDDFVAKLKMLADGREAMILDPIFTAVVDRLLVWLKQWVSWPEGFERGGNGVANLEFDDLDDGFGLPIELRKINAREIDELVMNTSVGRLPGILDGYRITLKINRW